MPLDQEKAIEIITKGTLDEFKEAFKKLPAEVTVDLRPGFNDEYHPLILAAGWVQHSKVQYCIEQKISLEIESKVLKTTPLMNALKVPHPQICDVLLDAGANLNNLYKKIVTDLTTPLPNKYEDHKVWQEKINVAKAVLNNIDKNQRVAAYLLTAYETLQQQSDFQDKNINTFLLNAVTSPSVKTLIMALPYESLLPALSDAKNWGTRTQYNHPLRKKLIAAQQAIHGDKTNYELAHQLLAELKTNSVDLCGFWEYAMASCFHYAKGKPQNYKRAIEYYVKAIEHADKYSSLNQLSNHCLQQLLQMSQNKQMIDHDLAALAYAKIMAERQNSKDALAILEPFCVETSEQVSDEIKQRTLEMRALAADCAFKLGEFDKAFALIKGCGVQALHSFYGRSYTLALQSLQAHQYEKAERELLHLTKCEYGPAYFNLAWLELNVKATSNYLQAISYYHLAGSNQLLNSKKNESLEQLDLIRRDADQSTDVIFAANEAKLSILFFDLFATLKLNTMAKELALMKAAQPILFTTWLEKVITHPDFVKLTSVIQDEFYLMKAIHLYEQKDFSALHGLTGLLSEDGRRRLITAVWTNNSNVADTGVLFTLAQMGCGQAYVQLAQIANQSFQAIYYYQQALTCLVPVTTNLVIENLKPQIKNKQVSAYVIELLYQQIHNKGFKNCESEIADIVLFANQGIPDALAVKAWLINNGNITMNFGFLQSRERVVTGLFLDALRDPNSVLAQVLHFSFLKQQSKPDPIVLVSAAASVVALLRNNNKPNGASTLKDATAVLNQSYAGLEIYLQVIKSKLGMAYDQDTANMPSADDISKATKKINDNPYLPTLLKEVPQVQKKVVDVPPPMYPALTASSACSSTTVTPPKVIYPSVPHGIFSAVEAEREASAAQLRKTNAGVCLNAMVNRLRSRSF